MRSKLAILVLSLALPLAASAEHLRPGRDADHAPDPAKIEQRLRSHHARLVAELAASLNLDDAGIVKLGQRLRKYDDQRVQLRLRQFELKHQLRALAQGEGKGDVSALARDLAHGRVEIAQVDEQELNDLLQGLSPENAQKAVQAVHRVLRDGRHGQGRAFRHGR